MPKKWRPKSLRASTHCRAAEEVRAIQLNLYLFEKQNCGLDQDGYGYTGHNQGDLNNRYGVLAHAVRVEYGKLLTLQKRSGEYKNPQSTYDIKAATQLIGSTPTQDQLVLFKRFQYAHYCDLCANSHHGARCRNNLLAKGPCLNIIFTLAPDGTLGNITTYFSPVGCSCEQNTGDKCSACEEHEETQTTCERARDPGHIRSSCEDCSNKQIRFEVSYVSQIDPMRTTWEFIPSELIEFIQCGTNNVRCKVEHQQFGPFQAETLLFFRGLERQQTSEFQTVIASARAKASARSSQRNLFQFARAATPYDLSNIIINFFIQLVNNIHVIYFWWNICIIIY